MNKSERLFHIVNFLRSRRAASIDDLARECGVSQRTLYRDVSALSELNIPIYHSGGYRLSTTDTIPRLGLNAEDIAIIRLALQCAPVRQTKFFSDRAKGVMVKLDTTFGSDSELRMLLKKCDEDLPLPTESELRDKSLRTFWSALSRGRNLWIVEAKEPRSGYLARPLRLRWENSSWQMVVLALAESIVKEVSLNDIRNVRVVRQISKNSSSAKS